MLYGHMEPQGMGSYLTITKYYYPVGFGVLRQVASVTRIPASEPRASTKESDQDLLSTAE